MSSRAGMALRASLIAEPEYGMEQWTYIVAANSCNWNCSIQVKLPSVFLWLLSHLRSFMSKFGIAHHHGSISKHGTSTVASSCFVIVVLQSQTLKATVWLCETIVIELSSWTKMWWQEIVLDLVCVPWSSATSRSHNLINSSKHGPHAWYCS